MADLKLAFRTLAKTPFVTTIAILSLALGIGANAAIYSMFDQLLLHALPVQQPERLVNLGAPGPKHGMTSCGMPGDCELVFSHPMFRDLEREQGSFSGLAAHRPFGVNLALGERTLSGLGVLVSGSYFSVLGTRPALGRVLTPSDDEVAGEHAVAVLSHRFWQRELGGDAGVLNRTVVINGQPMTVVGVAAKGFDGTTLGLFPDVFVPMVMRGAMEPTFPPSLDDRRAYWAYLFGRLKDGVSLEQAATDLNRIYSGILREVEAPLQTEMSEPTLAQFVAKRVTLEPGQKGQSSVHEQAFAPLALLLGITLLVLLIACANIANLLLARGVGRRQEMAIRGSLGARRGQLLRQLLTESVMLAVVGGAASLLVARWTLGALVAGMPEGPAETIMPELRPGVILFAGLVAIATGFLFGLYPALHATRQDLSATLQSSSSRSGGGRGAARFRGALVTAQIALSMALLVAAGLFIRSLDNISRIDLGLRTDNIAQFAIAPVLNGYEPGRTQVLFTRLEEELRSLPGVTAVTGAMVPVLGGNSWGTSVTVQGFDADPDFNSTVRYNKVGPGYLATLGIPLLAGREFTGSDGPGSERVAVVNEAFARRFDLEPSEVVGTYIAQGVRQAELDIRIVGLVQDARYSDLKDAPPAQLFLPYRQDEDLGFLYFYVRTAAEPGPVLRSIPGAVKRLDPNLPVDELRTLEQQVRESAFLDRFIGQLTSAFALLATLLAAIGLYGVLAYTVAQRTREMGLRMALGATSGHVQKLVLRQVAGMLVVGGILGLAAALALGTAASSLLFGLQGHDPMVLGASMVLLVAVALGAGYIPALRASRVDPMDALRYE